MPAHRKTSSIPVCTAGMDTEQRRRTEMLMILVVVCSFLVLLLLFFKIKEKQRLGIKTGIAYVPQQAQSPSKILQIQNSPGYLFASAVTKLVQTAAVSMHLIRGLKLRSSFVYGPQVFFQILTLSFKGMVMKLMVTFLFHVESLKHCKCDEEK